MRHIYSENKEVYIEDLETIIFKLFKKIPLMNKDKEIIRQILK